MPLLLTTACLLYEPLFLQHSRGVVVTGAVLTWGQDCPFLACLNFWKHRLSSDHIPCPGPARLTLCLMFVSRDFFSGLFEDLLFLSWKKFFLVFCCCCLFVFCLFCILTLSQKFPAFIFLVSYCEHWLHFYSSCYTSYSYCSYLCVL